MKKVCFLVCAVLVVCVYMPAQTAGDDILALSQIMDLRMEGQIPLRFTNAMDGKSVAGATVTIPGIGAFVTDSVGIISFPEQKDGRYTLQFRKEGFINADIGFEVKLSTVFSYRFSVSPGMNGEYLRIVLDWTQTPADLDLHLEKEGGYHLSYRNTRSSADGSAVLDRDARNGFGPETITIMETDPRAVYRVYIHDYSNSGRSASQGLARSGAAVRVYSRTGLVASFAVPVNRAGDRWNVFRIVNGRIEGE